MNKVKIAHYMSTGLLTLMIGGGVIMYFANYAEVAKAFTGLGFPTFLIYPLAIAKTLGLVAIWTRKSELLKDLAYAGFFYNLLLGTSAHLVAGDGEFAGALVALVLAVVSFATQRSAAFSKAKTDEKSAVPAGEMITS